MARSSSDNKAPRLVLASGSPRRSEILRRAGIAFILRPAEIDEAPLAGESADGLVTRLAHRKATWQIEPGEVVLGADTVVVADGEVLGKPADLEEAALMLARLSDRTHEVLTGYCMARIDRFHRVESVAAVGVSRVRFARLTSPQVRAYITEEYVLDKAGAYAIQGIASSFVHSLEGSLDNVVGLDAAMVRDLAAVVDLEL